MPYRQVLTFWDVFQLLEDLFILVFDARELFNMFVLASPHQVRHDLLVLGERGLAHQCLRLGWRFCLGFLRFETAWRNVAPIPFAFGFLQLAGSQALETSCQGEPWAVHQAPIVNILWPICAVQVNALHLLALVPALCLLDDRIVEVVKSWVEIDPPVFADTEWVIRVSSPKIWQVLCSPTCGPLLLFLHDLAPYVSWVVVFPDLSTQLIVQLFVEKVGWAHHHLGYSRGHLRCILLPYSLCQHGPRPWTADSESLGSVSSVSFIEAIVTSACWAIPPCSQNDRISLLILNPHELLLVNVKYSREIVKS